MADDRPEFDESLMPETEPASLGEIVLDDRHLRFAVARWPSETPRMQKYRVRQAIWARIQHRKPHPDDPGRRLLGGPQPGSGPKMRRRTGQALVEEAQKRQKEVIDAAFAPLAEDVDPMQRHKAAMNIVRNEREERVLDIAEDEYARKTTDEIRREAAQVLADMVRDGEIKIEEIIDIDPADVQEVIEDHKALPA